MSSLSMKALASAAWRSAATPLAAPIELIAASGVETADTPLIRVVIDTAQKISSVFEAAVDRGDIRLDQFFDEKYREIPGTNPKQFLTDYVALTDRILPPIQDPIQKIDPRIVFSSQGSRGNKFL